MPPKPVTGERVPDNSILEPTWFEKSANAPDQLNEQIDPEIPLEIEEEESRDPLNERIDPEGDFEMEDLANHLDYLTIGNVTPLATFAIRQATNVSQ